MLKRKRRSTTEWIRPTGSQLKKLPDLPESLHRLFVISLIQTRSRAIECHRDKEDLVVSLFNRCVILASLIWKTNWTSKVSCMPEYLLKNRWMIFKDKLSSSDHQTQSTLHIALYQMLVLDLISNAKDYRKFWTSAYNDLSKKLYAPIKIDCRDSHSIYSTPLLPNLVENSQSSILTPQQVRNKNLQKTYFQLSTSIAADKWEEENTNVENLKFKTRKVKLRLSIAQKEIMTRWMNTSRYVYNKCIEGVNAKTIPVNFMNARTKLVTGKTRMTHPAYTSFALKIKTLQTQIQECNDEVTKQALEDELKAVKRKKKLELTYVRNDDVMDWELETPKDIRAGSVQEAITAFKTNFTKLKRQQIRFFNVAFRKKSNSRQSLVLSKSSLRVDEHNRFVLLPEILGDLGILKTTRNKQRKKEEGFKITSDCRMMKDYNQWFLLIPIPIRPKLPPDKPGSDYCGIDLGIKTFATVFGSQGCHEFDGRRSILQKLNKKIMNLRNNGTTKSNIHKYETKKMNVNDDVHWKCCSAILKQYDTILCGDIKSHDIVTQRSFALLKQEMHDFRFHLFKQRLVYKARLLSKHVFFVKEHYTTRTCSDCGHCRTSAPNGKIFSCPDCKSSLGRDENAAKNILMKGLITFKLV